MGLLVRDEIALEGGHLVLAEEGGLAAAPEIPHEVRAPALQLRLLGVASLAHQLLAAVEQASPLAALPVHVHPGKAAVRLHGDAAVEHEHVVVIPVHGALFVHEVDVPLELFAALEGGDQPVHHQLFPGAQGIGVLGVHGGEVGIQQGKLLPAHGANALFPIHLVQQEPVLHPVFRVGQDVLPLQLELDDADGLVHPGDDGLAVLVKILRLLGQEAGAGVVPISLQGELGQGAHVDAVAVFQKVVVVVAQADAHGVGDAAAVAGGGAHPEDVVVAPLDVHVALLFQLVHDQMGAVPPVVDVAHDVQLVDDAVLHQMAHGDDELVRRVDVQDGVQDLAVVLLLVEVLAAGGHQLGDHILKILGQHLADLGAGVLGGGDLAHRHQLLEGDGVPLPGEQSAAVQLAQLSLRVIDEGGQAVPVRGGHIVPQGLVDLPPDGAGGVAQNVPEALVLAVDVADKVFRPLGEIQDRAEIDDLGAHRLGGGVEPGEHLQKLQGLFVKCRCGHSPFLSCCGIPARPAGAVSFQSQYTPPFPPAQGKLISTQDKRLPGNTKTAAGMAAAAFDVCFFQASRGDVSSRICCISRISPALTPSWAI